MLNNFIDMTKNEYNPYLDGAERCEYGNGWYTGKCSCPSHRRDRYYYSRTPENDLSKVYHYFVKSESYDILQIEPPTTPEDLKKAYRKMSLKTHPDKGGTADDFIKVKNAYEDILMVV